MKCVVNYKQQNKYKIATSIAKATTNATKDATATYIIITA